MKIIAPVAPVVVSAWNSAAEAGSTAMGGGSSSNSNNNDDADNDNSISTDSSITQMYSQENLVLDLQLGDDRTGASTYRTIHLIHKFPFPVAWTRDLPHKALEKNAIPTRACQISRNP